MISPDADTSPSWLSESEPGYVYERMADLIAARIESGEFGRFQRLPGERDLAQEYEVSLGTARRATQMLRDRGLVVTVRAKGTFVTDPSRRKQSQWGERDGR